MQLVAVAAWAILLPLHPLGVQTLVLGSEVIAILAVAASHDDFVAGHLKTSVLKAKGHRPKAVLLLAFGFWLLAVI
jgi:hypothetical protein